MTETLDEARDRLQARLDKGLYCPCCDQYAKRYRRQVNSSMVRSLIRIYKKGDGLRLNWVYIPDLLLRSHEEGKLAYWHLLEEAELVRDDGGRAGWWRVTPKGELFLLQGLRIPRYAIVYNAQCLGFENEEMVNVRDCLGVKFDLDDLMRR